MTNHPPFAKRPSTFTQSRHAVHCSFACVRYTVHAGVNQIYCTKITGALIAHSSHHKRTRSNPVWFVCTRTLYLLSSLYINRYNVFVYRCFYLYAEWGIRTHLCFGHIFPFSINSNPQPNTRNYPSQFRAGVGVCLARTDSAHRSSSSSSAEKFSRTPSGWLAFRPAPGAK